MLESWRWFGPEDPVQLSDIRQTGARGIVTALHHLDTGSVWQKSEILKRKAEIESEGLCWSVVESLPVHSDIKSGDGDVNLYIENYKKSLVNLGEAGLQCICYNFMPVVDWTRTDLRFPVANGSLALKFDTIEFAAYDLFILQREHAEKSYDPEVIRLAKERFDDMPHERRLSLENNVIAGLPGGEGAYDRDGIRCAIEKFASLGTPKLRQNLIRFLTEITPVAERVGLDLCIHPDDPAFSLFGLPRIVSNSQDLRTIFAAVPSSNNCLTLCAGSFGSHPDNDLVEMAKEFADRVRFVHLRNIKREPDGSFIESEHLDGDNDMVGLIHALLQEESHRKSTVGREIVMRPDHGHLMGREIEESGINPGYSFAGRLKGLSELRGVIHTLGYMAERGSV